MLTRCFVSWPVSSYPFRMASSAMITVPTTASRFALLQIDSDSDSEASDAGKNPTKGGRESSGKPRQGKAGGKAGQGNDKKKDKKKKRKEQQLTEANEVRHSSISRPSASYLCYCAADVTSVWWLSSSDVSLHLNWNCSWCCQVHSLVMVCLLFGDFHRLKCWDTSHTRSCLKIALLATATPTVCTFYKFTITLPNWAF